MTLLLLTASIDPRNCPRVTHGDPSVRLAEYRTALNDWITRLDEEWTILFVENSGHPLDDLRSAVAAHPARRCAIEFVQYVEEADVTAAGKGAGEAAMLDRVARSGVADEGDWLVKCTGRLRVSNPTRLLPVAPSGPAVSAAVRPDLAYVDTRLFALTPDAFTQYFTGLGSDVQEGSGRYFEHAFATAMHRGLARDLAFLPFAELPRFRGVSGSMGVRYGAPADVLRRRVHERLRRFVHDRHLTL